MKNLILSGIRVKHFWVKICCENIKFSPNSFKINFLFRKVLDPKKIQVDATIQIVKLDKLNLKMFLLLSWKLLLTKID